MKKKLRSILLGLMLIVSIFGLVACDEIGKVDTSVKNLTVTFIVDDATYQTVKTDNSSEITIPSEPTKEGFDFDGWYLDDEIWEKPFTLNTILDTPISDSLSVYAKWKVHEHKFEKSLTADETYHWYKSTCEHTDVVKDKVEHNYNGGDVCVDCGYNKTTGETEHVHTFSETLTFDDTYHWYQATCEHISEIKEKVKHNYLNYVFNNDATYEQDGTETGACVCGKTNTRTKENSKLVHGGVSFKTLTLGSNNEACGVVANGTESFNFINEIETSGTATFGVYLDEYCSQAVKTKIAPLSVGDNVFYIYVENTDNGDIIYNVTIRVKPLYEVTFNTLNGTAIASQSIEEGNTASKPIKDPTRTGYIFKGWNYDFSTPITSNVTINVNTWQAITYKVKYDDNGATSGSMQEETYTYDQIYTLATNVFEKTGYTFNGWSCNGTAYTDGQSVKNLSAKNNAEITLTAQWQVTKYKVTISEKQPNIGTIKTNIISENEYDYNTSISLEVDTIVLGYEFIGWSDGEKIITKANPYIFNLPAKDITLLAEFDVKEEMKKFAFISTKNSCTIKRVDAPTATEIIVPDYVSSIEQGAFRDCGSLVSITLPFVGACIHNNSTEENQYPFGYIFGKNSYNNSISINQSYYENRYSNYTTAYYHIPKSLRKVKITGGEIVLGSFSNCYFLTSIEIPNGLTSIGDMAFNGCSGLLNITIPNSITKIGDGTFYECSSLNEIKIPNSVTSIDNEAFYYCDSLEKVYYNGTIDQWAMIKFSSLSSNPLSEANHLYINNEEVTEINLTTATKISKFAFVGLQNLTKVTMSSSVKSIDENAFRYCSKLTSVEISNSVTNIKDYAFSFCESLPNVNIPNSITSIGIYAFYKCRGLLGMTIPNSVTSIGEGAFNGCSKLNNVLFEESSKITSISFGLFEGCNSLTSIKIPNGVTSINDNAFYYCRSLTEIEIPGSVTSISIFALRDCDSMTKINFTGTIDQWAMIDFNPTKLSGNSFPLYYASLYLLNKETNKFEEVTQIHLTATNISRNAFNRCSSLTTVVISDSVMSIGDRAFYGCSGLSKVYYNGTSEGWAKISIETDNSMLTDATRYYYSETEPTDTTGNYWHYVDGVVTEW